MKAKGYKHQALVFKNQRQHMQYTCGIYDKVKELMKDLGVSMYIIDSIVKFDSKQYDAYIEQCSITELDRLPNM